MTKVKHIRNQEGIQNEIAAIKREAKQLSGYAGSNYPYAGGNDDEGYDDDEAGMDKKGGGSGKREAALTFKFNLVNKGSASLERRVAMLSGLFDNETEMNAQGYGVAGIFRDGQVVPGATVGTNDVVLTSTRNQTWKMLKKFVERNASRLIGFTVSSDNTDFYETEIVMEPASPFQRMGQKFIDLSLFYAPDQFSAKKAEVNLIGENSDFSFDDQNVPVIVVPPNTKLSFTLRFAGVDNIAKDFDNRASSNRGNSRARELAMGSFKHSTNRKK